MVGSPLKAKLKLGRMAPVLVIFDDGDFCTEMP
jgi:hypothetical protein